MDEGNSWSGNERHCVFLNTRDGRFADVSAISGLDFQDDGRSFASVDWDGDGDLDLWFRNRTGPQLRFMRNDVGNGKSLSILLRGTRCNRDAIGAVASMTAGGRTVRRFVSSGDGYLSQSSRWLHFGVPGGPVEKVQVQWPGGDSELFSGFALGTRYHLVEGSGKASSVDVPGITVDSRVLPTQAETGSHSIMLRVPFSLPPSLNRAVFSGRRPMGLTLVNFWAQWCGGCEEELTEWSARAGELEKVGIEVFCLNMDKRDDRRKAVATYRRLTSSMARPFSERICPPNAARALRVFMRHVLGHDRMMPMPASLLVDSKGMVHMVHLGPVGVDQLLADRNVLGAIGDDLSRRSARGGRWYFFVPRDFQGLAGQFEQEGLSEDARFYRMIASRRGALRGR